jgi:heat-inducible transcriptional repressor
MSGEHTSDHPSDTQALDERKERILREIVEAYVRLGEPIGSKNVADVADLGVSSATIRNEMAILEREGYISHPHTSAGRTPTDKGYRYYVDVLAPKVSSEPGRRREIERFLAGAVSALDDLLERTSQLLSELTDYTSLAAAPPVHESLIERLEVVRLGGSRFLLICIGEDGWHDERLVELQQDSTDEDVQQAVRIANKLIAHQSPSEGARVLSDAVVPSEVEPLLRGAAEALRTIARSTGRVFTGGMSKLIVWEPVDTAQRVLEMLDARGVEPILPDPSPNAITVRIGRELAMDDLRDLSLIAAGYTFGKRAGTLGIIGPTRMDYPSVMSTVADVASTLSRVLRQLSQ